MPIVESREWAFVYNSINFPIGLKCSVVTWGRGEDKNY